MSRTFTRCCVRRVACARVCCAVALAAAVAALRRLALPNAGTGGSDDEALLRAEGGAPASGLSGSEEESGADSDDADGDGSGAGAPPPAAALTPPAPAQGAPAGGLAAGLPAGRPPEDAPAAAALPRAGDAAAAAAKGCAECLRRALPVSHVPGLHTLLYCVTCLWAGAGASPLLPRHEA